MFLGLRPGHQLAVTAQRAIYAIYVQDVTLGRMEDRLRQALLSIPKSGPTANRERRSFVSSPECNRIGISRRHRQTIATER